jgi:hypothetical protein
MNGIIEEYKDIIYLNLSKFQKKQVLRRTSLLFYLKQLSVIDVKNNITQEIEFNVVVTYENEGKRLGYKSKRPLEMDLDKLALYKKIKKRTEKNQIFIEVILSGVETHYDLMSKEINDYTKNLLKNNF